MHHGICCTHTTFLHVDTLKHEKNRKNTFYNQYKNNSLKLESLKVQACRNIN